MASPAAACFVVAPTPHAAQGAHRHGRAPHPPCCPHTRVGAVATRAASSSSSPLFSFSTAATAAAASAAAAGAGASANADAGAGALRRTRLKGLLFAHRMRREGRGVSDSRAKSTGAAVLAASTSAAAAATMTAAEETAAAAATASSADAHPTSHALRLVDDGPGLPAHPVLQVLRARASSARRRGLDREARRRAATEAARDATKRNSDHQLSANDDDEATANAACDNINDAVHGPAAPKLALCIEGGGMRGAVSAGMVAAIKYCGLEDCFDAVYGSSAGAIVGAYFVSRQLPVYGAQIYYEVLCGPMSAVAAAAASAAADPAAGNMHKEGSPMANNRMSSHAAATTTSNLSSAKQRPAKADRKLVAPGDNCTSDSSTDHESLLGSEDEPLLLTCEEPSPSIRSTAMTNPVSGSLTSDCAIPSLPPTTATKKDSRTGSKMTVPSGRFIDLRALRHHPYLRRLRGARPTHYYSPASRPVLHLDYLLNTVVREQRPLDWAAFMRTHVVQPLRPVAASLTTLTSHVLDFNSRDELLDCLRASARVPGIAGDPVPIGDDFYCDGLLCEPIPFRSAIADGCTHILVLRTKPDAAALRTPPKTPGIYEKHIASPYFTMQDRPADAAARFMYGGGNLKVYRADIETLVDANQRPAENGPYLFSIVPPTVPEVSQLESRPERIFEGVRAGFAAAYEALSPFATPTSDYTKHGPISGYQAARFVFSDSELAATMERLQQEKLKYRTRRKERRQERRRERRSRTPEMTVEERFFV